MSADMPCRSCWPWALPLALPARRTTGGFLVPLTYDERLLYHWHVVIHQRGVPAS